MRFLVIAQDLRVSGTSEGIVSRSFIGKLRKLYSDAIIDVFYLKHFNSNDELDLLPVNKIQEYVLNVKIPILTIWINKIYWRLFHVSLKERYIQKVYRSYISKINYRLYDFIFIRSSGIEYETIFGSKDLPILKKSIINFHDPYPQFWYPGANKKLTNLDLHRLKLMAEVVSQAKKCMSPSNYLSDDLQFLFGSNKKFYTLPHQFELSVFNLSDTCYLRRKNKKVSISYHGALMYGRTIINLLNAYDDLIKKHSIYKELTELVLRVKGDGVDILKKKYAKHQNIHILNTLNFSNSANEQLYESDILLILENGPFYSNVLVGKAPFLESCNKPILCLTTQRSELKKIIKNKMFIANMYDENEIKTKLEYLIVKRLESNKSDYPFGDYFSDERFKTSLAKILN